jgi:hypothetical protein
MKNQRSFLFLFILFIASKSFAQDFRITQLKLEFANNQLNITYNIDSNNPNDKFLISVEIIKRQDGESIQPKSITGDIGDNIKSGNYKRIIWDLGKDAIYLDEDITVEIIGDKLDKLLRSYSKGTLMFSSATLPGLGQTKITGKPWWLGGVTAYGALAGGIIFHKISLNTHDKYLLEKEDILAREKLYNKCEKEWLISTGLFATAATLWASNMIWIAVAPNKQNSDNHVNMYLKPAIFREYVGMMVSVRVNF